MRRIIFLAALVAAGLTGCEEDDALGSSLSGGDGQTSTSTDTSTAGYENDDDLLANTTIGQTITITFSPTSAATATGDTDGVVAIAGNDVVVTQTGDVVVNYVLHGTTTDGFFKLYSNRKSVITLDGVSITNPDGAAINNQSKKRTFVVVAVGTRNALTDGTAYGDATAGEDMKACLFSEGQLIFSGGGSLTVEGNCKAGIRSDDYVRFLDGTDITVTTTSGNAVRGNDAVIVSDATLTLSVSGAGDKGISSDSLVEISGGATTINITSNAVWDADASDIASAAGIKADQKFLMTGGALTVTASGAGGKGIKSGGTVVIADGVLDVTTTGQKYAYNSSNTSSPKGIKAAGAIVISGGTVTVRSSRHEAIESKSTIDITGGTVYASASDDALNAASDFTITGGLVMGLSTGNDGMDANGNFYVKGGTVYAVGASTPEVALDANTEGGKKLYITGGTLVAIGGLEGGAQLSQACWQASWSKSTWYGLYDDGSLALAFKTPTSGGTTLVVSTAGTPSLKAGVSPSGTAIWDGMGYTSAATTSGGTSVSLSAYTAAGGMMGGGGMGPGDGGHGGRP